MEFSVAGGGVLDGGVQFAAPVPRVAGDYDSDFDVDSQDLLFFLGVWTGALDVGNPDVAAPRGDLTGDSDVDSDDLLLFLGSWTGALNAHPELISSLARISLDPNAVIRGEDGVMARSALAAAVPEPTGLAASIVCTLTLVGRLRKRTYGPTDN